MASAAAQIFLDYLKSEGVNAGFIDPEESVVKVGWKLDTTRISDYIIFDDDSKYAQIQGHEFIQIPEDKYDIILREINNCNKEYRWAKFYLNEEEGEIVVNADAIIQLDSCAEEVDEIMHRLNSIVDDAYPKFMKALWA